MARYSHDYIGIPARMPGQWDTSRDSMDPNFRGGYRGERMREGGRWQAAYGWHRRTHAEDLEGFGGYRGRYRSGGQRVERGYDRAYLPRRGGAPERDERR